MPTHKSSDYICRDAKRSRHSPLDLGGTSFNKYLKFDRFQMIKIDLNFKFKFDLKPE